MWYCRWWNEKEKCKGKDRRKRQESHAGKNNMLGLSVRGLLSEADKELCDMKSLV